MEELKGRRGRGTRHSECTRSDQAAVNAFADVTGDQINGSTSTRSGQGHPLRRHDRPRYSRWPRARFGRGDRVFAAVQLRVELRPGQGALPGPAAGRVQGPPPGRFRRLEDVSGGVQVTQVLTFEREGGDKPAVRGGDFGSVLRVGACCRAGVSAVRPPRGAGRFLKPLALRGVTGAEPAVRPPSGRVGERKNVGEAPRFPKGSVRLLRPAQGSLGPTPTAWGPCFLAQSERHTRHAAARPARVPRPPEPFP